MCYIYKSTHSEIINSRGQALSVQIDKPVEVQVLQGKRKEGREGREGREGEKKGRRNEGKREEGRREEEGREEEGREEEGREGTKRKRRGKKKRIHVCYRFHNHKASTLGRYTI